MEGQYPFQEVFYELEHAADTREQGKFETCILSTKELMEWDYCAFIGDGLLDFRIHDCPGSWLGISQSTQNGLISLIETAQRSSVIIVTINAAQLMESDSVSPEGMLASNISFVLDKAFENDDDREHLILLVPTKCETYMQDAEERDRLLERVEEVFSATIRLAESPAYKGRLAVVYLPVQTVGNVRFQQILNPWEEVYIKDTKRPFSPKNVDQLTFWLLKFLLRQYVRAEKYADSDIEADVDKWLKRLGTGGIAVLCGKELLGL